MEKITFEGENYYFNKGVIYDESFIEIPESIAKKILREYYKEIKYESFDQNSLLEHVKQLKISGFYKECLDVIEFTLNKYFDSIDLYRLTFPIITSCYRALGEPQKAIDFWLNNRSIFRSCLSVPLLTSVSAAYCDVGDYETAKKYANKAYALQGGGKNYQTELSLVYQRIRKETRDY